MAYKRPRQSSPSASQKRSRGAGPSNIKLGTELPDEDGDDGAFVPVWKQTVTDERGRRRLHGAFTGGFSAGYFNTVGSKEGWAPKAFVSSRSNRNKDKKDGATQRPEDFMDEEDLALAAESRSLEMAQSFAALGGSGGAGAANDDFFGLFMTAEDTMGVKILQKMGWRRDQGVGRKVRRPARPDDSIMDTDDVSSQHLFAPRDTSMMTATPQENRKGLGFQSEARLSKDDEDAEAKDSPSFAFLDRLSKPNAPKKPAVKKSSFGVGVLNDTGSDDEDPYELGPKITFNKSIGKEKKAKKPSKFAKATTSEKVVFVPKKAVAKPTSSLVLSSPDGSIPLRGFVFATVILDQNKKRYPPPKIPPGWKSAKGAAATGVDGQGFTSVADAAKVSTLDAQARASLLGETPLPGKSVFDYLSKEARDRIAAITGKTNLPQGRGEAAPEGHKPEGQAKTLWSFVPNLEKDIAAAALAKGATGWMPYAEDLKKRARYVGFLELRAGLKEGLPERPSEMPVSDWAKELQEFAHAAQVFKPTSGIMASRFTSASSSTQPATGGGSEGNDLLRTATKKPEDPAEQAAKLGMYGPMTRSEFPFHPSRLLCKRFNVPPPADVPLSADPRADDFGPRTQEPVSKPEMERMVREYAMRGSAMQQRPAWMNQPSEDVPMADVASTLPTAHATVDVENNEALAKERAPDEVFKAIFGDSDDE